MTISDNCFLLKGVAQELLAPENGYIEDNSASLVLTDPPYIISKDSGFKKLNKNGEYGGLSQYAISTDFGDWDKTHGFTLEMLEEVIHAMPRILKPGGAAIIFFDGWKLSTLKQQMEKAGFVNIRMIEWRKTNAVPINSRKNFLTNGREYALYGHLPDGEPINNEANPLGVYHGPIYSGKDRFHTTQKSVPVFEEIIKDYSNPGDLVIDPFSGSATTGISALNTKRRYKGSEPDDKYHEESKKRLENHIQTLQGEPSPD